MSDEYEEVHALRLKLREEVESRQALERRLKRIRSRAFHYRRKWKSAENVTRAFNKELISEQKLTSLARSLIEHMATQAMECLDELHGVNKLEPEHR